MGTTSPSWYGCLTMTEVFVVQVWIKSKVSVYSRTRLEVVVHSPWRAFQCFCCKDPSSCLRWWRRDRRRDHNLEPVSLLAVALPSWMQFQSVDGSKSGKCPLGMLWWQMIAWFSSGLKFASHHLIAITHIYIIYIQIYIYIIYIQIYI